MLWLAGLIGVAGVGAASMVAITPEQTDDEDTDDVALNDNDLTSSGWTNMIPGDPDMQLDPVAQEETPPQAPGIAVPDDDIYSALLEERDQDSDVPAHAAADSTYLIADAFAAKTIDSSSSLAEWVGEGTASEPVDYQSESESLVLVWDDSNGEVAEPDLFVSPDPDDPEVMQVRMGDNVVADVYGDSDLAVSDIIMIPLSSAELVGLSHA